MKRFEFSLEKVLRVKQQRERLARQRQQQARAQLETTQAAAAAIRDQIAQTAGTLAAQIGQEVNTASWLTHYRYSLQMGQALEVAENRVREAARLLDIASAQRTRMTLEVEALLALRRRQWQAYRHEVERTRQKHLDDVGLQRWRTRRRDQTGEH